MVKELSANYTSSLSTYKPFHPACERSYYESLPSAKTEKIIEDAQKYLDYQFKEIPMTVFMEYTRTGNRSNFEAMNFEKRYAINALVLGECVEHKGRFLDGIINGIYSILGESAWQLPAHNSYIRDTQAFIIPDMTDPVLELFSAETGALLATIAYVLGNELDEVSPFIKKAIYQKINERVYLPYINRHFWWMGRGDEPMNNWTVWCTQNVLLSVFLNPESDDTLRKSVFDKASASLDFFLKEYGNDGCCDEGAHYYHHSALCLFNSLNVLNSISNGHFDSLFNEEKIKNICNYIFKVNIDGKHYFNYADCSATLDRRGACEYLFAKATGDFDMMRFVASDYKQLEAEKNEGELNLYLLLLDLFASDEILSFDTNAPIKRSDCFFESVGVFIARDSHFALSVKSGDNDDSHNHNDTGSLIIYKDGKPLLIDVGVETYTKKTFSSERYDIWTMQSAYHNLPTINGIMQSPGAKYHSTDVEYFLSDKICDIKMDIAKAYPKEAKVESYKRHVSLYKEKQIVIEDNITFSKGDISLNNYFLSFMSYEKPVITGNEIAIGNGKLQVMGESLISYETIPITDKRLQWAWKHDIYRIIVTPKTERVMIVIQ